METQEEEEPSKKQDDVSVVLRSIEINRVETKVENSYGINRSYEITYDQLLMYNKCLC